MSPTWEIVAELAQLNDARRHQLVSEQHLAALCGRAASDQVDEDALNDLALRSPVSGQVTSKMWFPPRAWTSPTR